MRLFAPRKSTAVQGTRYKETLLVFGIVVLMMERTLRLPDPTCALSPAAMRSGKGVSPTYLLIKTDAQ